MITSGIRGRSSFFIQTIEKEAPRRGRQEAGKPEKRRNFIRKYDDAFSKYYDRFVALHSRDT